MAWERCGDGLKLVGDVHFDASKVENAIDRLSFARNRPATMCRLLREGVKKGVFSKNTLWRFSKWCHWEDQSERDAQQIAKLLFGEVPQRFRDEQNKPHDDALTSYQQFLKSVVARYHKK